MNTKGIRFDYYIKDIVFLKTDKDQEQRIVTGILAREDGISYCLMNGTVESWHYSFEITSDRNVLKTLS